MFKKRGTITASRRFDKLSAPPPLPPAPAEISDKFPTTGTDGITNAPQMPLCKCRGGMGTLGTDQAIKLLTRILSLNPQFGCFWKSFHPEHAKIGNLHSYSF